MFGINLTGNTEVRQKKTFLWNACLGVKYFGVNFFIVNPDTATGVCYGYYNFNFQIQRKADTLAPRNKNTNLLISIIQFYLMAIISL